MDILRNKLLQSIVSLLFLLTLLFSQTQLLYACEQEDEGIKRVCCCGDHSTSHCPMEKSCSMHEKTETCCEISYDLLLDEVFNFSSVAPDIFLHFPQNEQPPPIYQNVLIDLQLKTTVPIQKDNPLLFSDGSHTYLFSQRLRL